MEQTIDDDINLRVILRYLYLGRMLRGPRPLLDTATHRHIMDKLLTIRGAPEEPRYSTLRLG